MKSFLKHLLVVLIVSLTQKAIAQSFPVNVNPTIHSPYSPYLSDYIDPGSQKLQVNVQLKDTTLPEYACKFRLTIEGVGITIRTRQNFTPQPTILQGGGIPNVLYGEDLAEYFNPANLDFAGISKADYTKGAKLPEGIYRFSFEVLDYNRGTTVSNKGFAIAWIILNDPPLLNLPRNESKVKIVDPTNIVFNWTPRHTGSPNAAFTTEYIFRLVELWPATRNPYDAFLSQQPLYETTTNATQIVYGPAEPALIPGKKYAWQVQAKDVDGKDLFKNDGKSEVYTFQYGDPLGIPKNLRQDQSIGNSSILILRWQPASDGATPEQYRLRYRKKGTEASGIWYEDVADQLWEKITDVQPDTEYEIQIRSEARPQYSDYSPSAYFRTEKKSAAKYECGKEDKYTPSGNTNPLMALVPGDTISMRDFKIRVEEVIGSNGNYSGKGWMQVPWFNGAWVHVSFSGPVNELHEMYGGSVESIRTPGGRAEQLLEKAYHIGEKPATQTKAADSTTIAVTPDYSIPGTIDTIYIEDGKIVVVDTESTKSTFEPKKDEKTGKVRDIIVADAAGNSYTVGEDGKVTKTSDASAIPPVVASVSSEEDGFMQEIIQFYLDEITAYLTANPQYDKGPYYSDEVVKVLDDLPSCLQTRADDIAYIKRYLKHLQNDQSDRAYLVNLIRKSVAAFGESLVKAIEARNKPGNKNKKLRDLLPVEDWKLVTNSMCEYLVIPAQEYHITTSVEKTFKTEGDCFTRALKRGMEVKTSFDMAAYAALIEVGLCLTEKGNCAGTDHWSQFSCGVANSLVQELDVVAMGEGVATLLITQVKNKYNCIADGDLIDVVVQEPTMEQSVHTYSKCVLGFDMTLDEWKKLHGTVEKYVATNWQDPYLHGQATVFVASLVIPVTKLSKIKLLGKLKINPNFANKIDDLAKLSEAAGDSKKLEKLADELTIVKQADELITISDDAVTLGEDLATTAKSYLTKTTRPPGVVDIVVHGSGNTYKIILNGVEYTLDSRGLANWIKSKGYSDNTIRLLSCSGKESAQDIANKLGQKVIATEDVVRLHADGGISTAKNSDWYEFSPGNTDPQLITKPRPPSNSPEPFVELGKVADEGNVSASLTSKLTERGINEVKSWLSKTKLSYVDKSGSRFSGSSINEKILSDLDEAIGNKKVIETLEDNQQRLSIVLERPGQTNQVVSIHATSQNNLKLTVFEPAYNEKLNPKIAAPVSENRLVPDYKNTSFLHPATKGKSITIEMKGNRNADFKAANEAAGFGSTYEIPTFVKPDGTIVKYTWHHLDDFRIVNGKAYCTMQLVETTVHGGSGVTGMAHTGSVAQWRAYYGSGY